MNWKSCSGHVLPTARKDLPDNPPTHKPKWLANYKRMLTSLSTAYCQLPID